MNGESLDIKQDNLHKLKELFPDVFTENEIDWEKLKATFSDDINFNNERYVLNWAGKADAFKCLQIPTTATLTPQPEESVNFDTTQNVFIEGENLEVLKVLQKSYYGKIKCIIIDPPYNTGSDSFIYPDSFKENKADYEKRIGDKDEAGYLMKEGLFRKNSKDSGHFHSNWLSMMYPRLFLAKNLLKDEGVIFIHIDDNEVHNLRLLMNEIFGEENFIANVPRITKKAGKTADVIAKNNDYILCFQKSEKADFKSYEHTDEGYKYGDEFEDIRGKYKLSQTLDYASIQYSPSLDYEIEIEGQILRPGNVTVEEMEARKKRNPATDFCWRWSKDLYQFGLKNGFIVLKPSKEGFRIYTKTYQNATISKKGKEYFIEVKTRTKSATTLDFVENKYSNDNARKDLAKLFDSKVFDYSKPVALLKTLCFLASENNDIVLDFFSGSGTTAQAVLELNKEDRGARKFILVQLPELTDESTDAYIAKYKTIADISKDRIRKAIKKIEKEKIEKPKMLDNDKSDFGFKVFKLSPSNFKIWRSKGITEDNLSTQLNAFTNPVRQGSEKENMLFELLLKAGYTLTDKIEEKGNFYVINDGELIIALEKIDQQIIDAIINSHPKKVITLDNLFAGNDQLKTNTVLQMKDAGVEFKTI